MELLRRKLQDKLGNSLRVKLETFCNWANTQKNEDVLSVAPKSIDEVKAVIHAARALKMRIRCAGGSQSWSPLFSDTGQIVLYTNLIKSDYANGEQISMTESSEGPLVTLMGGVTIDELREFQLKHNICIPCNVNNGSATLAGMIGTACHGIGRTSKTISEHIVKMRIVNSDGDLKVYNMKDERMMRAVRCHVGLFGVVIDVTCQMYPMFMVETTHFCKTAQELFFDPTELKDIVDNNWSVEMVWFPFNSITSANEQTTCVKRRLDKEDWDPKEDQVWIRAMNKSSRSQQDSRGSIFYKWHDVADWLSRTGGLDLEDFLRHHSNFTPLFLKQGFRDLLEFQETTYEQSVLREVTNAIHWRDNTNSEVTLQFGFSVIVDEKYSNIRQLFQYIMNKIQSEAENGMYPVNMTVEVAFTGLCTGSLLTSSSIYNDMKSDHGVCCHIGFSSLPGTSGLTKCFIDIAKHFISNDNVLPHMGKMWTFIEGIDDHIHKELGDNMTTFVNLLDKSGADPDGLFLNYRLQHLLFPALDDRRQRFLIDTEKVYEMAMSEDQTCLCSLS